MSERIRQPSVSSVSGANIDVEDPWLDDQTTTQFARIEAPPAEPAADDLQTASHKSKPPWWRVLTVCIAAAASLVLGQLLWASRAMPADAPAAQVVDTSAARRPDSTSDAAEPPAFPTTTAIDSTIAPSAEQPAPSAAGGQSDSRKRRDKTRLRKSTAAASGKQQDGQPATLNIDSEPWSDVTIDTIPAGRTPLRGISLKPGKRKLLLRNPESDITKILILHVLPGESIERSERLVQ
jgi:hypothetical protein